VVQSGGKWLTKGASWYLYVVTGVLRSAEKPFQINNLCDTRKYRKPFKINGLCTRNRTKNIFLSGEKFFKINGLGDRRSAQSPVQIIVN
jgi:hypothetical protein